MPDKLKNARISLLVNAWLSVAGASIFGIIFLLIGVASLASMSGAEAATLGGTFSVLGIVFALLFAGFAALSFISAKAIKEKKSWARITGVITAILIVGNFPLGTVLAVLIFIGLFDQSATAWFGE